MPMKPCPELRPTGWDALIALAVAALAGVLALVIWSGSAQTENLMVRVSTDGVETEQFALSNAPAEKTYVAHGYTLHVRFEEGTVRVLEADCPTQDCVHTGAISKGGQSIVCLPARVVIELRGGADSGVDAVIG